MIWYEMPAALSMALFFVLLSTTALQIIVALEAGELIRNRRALRFIRLLYGLLALLSAALTMEAITALVSTEGGIYLEIRGLHRYISLLPALLYLYYLLRHHLNFPEELQPSLINCFVPLLFLPPVGKLPGLLPLAFTIFAAALLLFDAAGMLLSFAAYSRREITRSVLSHIIRHIDHGISVANSRGWIVEANPAFISKCRALGMDRAGHIDEFEAALRKLQERGRLRISELERGRSLGTEKALYLLQRSSFKAGGKYFTQLTLSDVTETARTSSKVERENERLAESNMKLRAIISAMEIEERARERERLCRAAHDLWSQRLALAGLSLDILLGDEGGLLESGTLEEIGEILKEPAAGEPAQSSCDPTLVLQELTAMYERLGVSVKTSGEAGFSSPEREALCAVIREALANAVRHAYARQIKIHFFEEGERAGLEIENDCLDERADIVEGRGLHDMKNRIHHAGGMIQYAKGAAFTLRVVFPRGSMNQGRCLQGEDKGCAH
ncbi:MAG: hypothetical protein GX878_10055 [Firmicutes bacterium]|nr:hypothetical protein [Bacillota bacterium]